MNKGEGRGFYNLCLNVYRKLLTAVAVANIINAGKILTGNRIKLGRITRKVHLTTGIVGYIHGKFNPESCASNHHVQGLE